MFTRYSSFRFKGIVHQQMVIISPSFTNPYVIQIHIVLFFSCETLKLVHSVNLVSFIYYDSFY